MEANGTLVWYYKICKREVWLMSRNIVPDQKDENIDLGRFIHENSYGRKDKEITFGNVRFDIVYKDDNKLVIGETKKSSKFKEASKYQLIYYLYTLKEAGINAEGVLLYPEERKRIEVKITEKTINELFNIIKDIERIVNDDEPIKVEKNIFCKNCGYREYCYA